VFVVRYAHPNACLHSHFTNTEAVKRGSTPFCKHYAAAIAQLIYEKEVSPKDKINYIKGKVLEELLQDK